MSYFFTFSVGDFCFTLMETVVPSLLLLKFNHIGAPNWAVGLIVVTIPYALSMAVNSWFSFKSDRFRSRWGRTLDAFYRWCVISNKPFVPEDDAGIIIAWPNP